MIYFRTCLFAVVSVLVMASTSPAKWPTLYIIGDSTVETRENAGDDEQQGWGGHIDDYLKDINLENHALGGTSSRSFRRDGHWQKVLDQLEEGDFVMMQFGHNDGGSLSKDTGRTSLKGIDDETQDVTHEKTGETETVHTYGWYMQQYIREARAKGAVVIVCSPVPRCLWDSNGKCGRADSKNSYRGWSRRAAQNEDAWFVDLSEIVADRYDEFGSEEEVREEYFYDHHTHTNGDGAELNAECVIAGLRAQRDCPLYKHLNSKAMKIRPYRD